MRRIGVVLCFVFLLGIAGGADARTAAQAFSSVRRANLQPVPSWPSYLPPMLRDANWTVESIRGKGPVADTPLSSPNGFAVDYGYPFQGGFGGGEFSRTSRQALNALLEMSRANGEIPQHIDLGRRVVVKFRPGSTATFWAFSGHDGVYVYSSKDFGGPSEMTIGRMIASMRLMSHLRTPGPAQVTTQATIFRAFSSDGTETFPTQSRAGSCNGGALTIDRNDAWRCFVGNIIYDPCFSSPQADGIVVCPDAELNRGIEIDLSTGLPQRYANHRGPSLHDQPWNIQLTSGRRCVFSSGASNFAQGKRLNYFCTGDHTNGLWGFPDRHADPWTIAIGAFSSTALHARRAIRHVWM